ncbi:MAG: adenylate/guanylate cyclase domain-containing protein [Treponema sp.]|nr:adenylate/guanylate cyclase domain-containing protein [Treponema sp.]
MKNFKNGLIGLAAAVVFSLLYFAGIMTALEDQIYNLFLRFRADRVLLEDIVFLNIDDPAIDEYGIFPWPRHIYADGLLRLKEYGVRAAIFDIEFIDRSGHQGIDSLYLEHGLGNDFARSFSEITSNTRDLLSAIQTGRIRNADIPLVQEDLLNFINREQFNLYNRTQNVARDNDQYFALAIALNGNTWSTLNLREHSLAGEQALRRIIAEERFSYPVNASHNAFLNGGFVDILPAYSPFSLNAKGAGFTNVEVDEDATRRRVYLAQNINDNWYLQLSFAPLINYLGNPEIQLERRKLTIKQAQLSDGRQKDIVIPLDNKGRMMLNWPKQDYYKKYKHVSFAEFSYLETIETEVLKYTNALFSTADIHFFAYYDNSLSFLPIILNDAIQLFDAAYDSKYYAMNNTSDDAFNDFVNYRSYAYELLGELFADDPAQKILEVSSWFEGSAEAESIEDEAYYIISLLEVLGEYLNEYEEIQNHCKEILKDKFVIMGQTNTGTTDIGRNPFHSFYINVGTHGVVLDTILSESFLVPIDHIWRILFMLIFIPLFFMFTIKLPPVIRASAGFASALLFLVITVLLFRFTGFFWGPIGLILAMITAIIIREIISYASSEKEKSFIRNAFSTYVSSDVVKEIIADPSRLQLGGTKYHMTALFTDIKGFSTISEKLGDPTKLVSLLNKYLSAMSDVVLAEKGTIDKYIGDAIVAFFGAPIPLSDHALRACVSAIRMKKIEEELNKEIMENNLSPIPVLTRIGINTGSMVAGNMGTANKMNYTIMGNAVNLSARLESVNSQYGTWILASEQTVKETGEALLYRKLDRVRVVGINEPVRLCELIDMADSASENNKKLVATFHEALECFEKRDWKKAVEGFNETLLIKPGDVPSTIYLDRLKQFSVTLPDDSWDGVYNLTSK